MPNESATVRSRLKYSLGVHSPTHEDSNCYLLSVILSNIPSTVKSCLRYSLYNPLKATLESYNPKDHSQRTRFIFGRNSNITSLDKLWYTYSYIYKPTSTTIQYGIFVSVLASLHTSPIWSSAILKHAAPTLPSSLVCPFFVIFSLSTIFLSPADAVNPVSS